jgi:polar amino acid transport system substrate-binding protein
MSPPPDIRVADLVRAGKIRLGLFVPQYTKDAHTGELRVRGTGFIGIEITRAIATRLGIAAQIIEYATPAEVLQDLEGGACDIAVMGIQPSRVAQLDFSPPVVAFDFAYLCPAGCRIRRAADADQEGLRIAFVHGHASSLALARNIKRAKLVGADMPDAAFDLLRGGLADILAFPRQELIDYAANLPGSHIVEEPYGVNLVGFAIRKGNAALLAYVSEFLEEAKAAGAIQRMLTGGELPGFRVAASKSAK